ncbi:MAG: nucleotide exchange factor GrpE [Firmicutes bacterium]|nr:nucleotide exchange factor GrpE [Bacillota bacterium]
MSEEAREIRIEDPAEETSAAQADPVMEPESEAAAEAEQTDCCGEPAEGQECPKEPVDGAEGSSDEEPEDPDQDGSQPEESGEEPESGAEDNARYLRLLAEFQNYKKRTEKEKSDLYSYANEKIMTELLEVMDNFERALEQGESDGFKEGMELIFNQLENVLSKAGLAEIAALGEDFDPNVHNAVMTEETDEYESGKVSGVMQKGYTLNGKVIRPSMVKVVN